MKKFVYMVAGSQWIDSVAFGEAWKAAKATATALHLPVYRDVVYANGVVRHEVYYARGYFNNVKFMATSPVMVF